jgi:hypothetical protein
MRWTGEVWGGGGAEGYQEDLRVGLGALGIWCL